MEAGMAEKALFTGSEAPNGPIKGTEKRFG